MTGPCSRSADPFFVFDLLMFFDMVAEATMPRGGAIGES